MRTAPLQALALAATLLLTACASTTTIMRSSKEATPARPAATILVAGVTADDSVRRRYEEVFARELQRAGLSGIRSSDIIPSIQGMPMEALHAHMMAASDRADAVIHVQLVSLGRTQAMSPTDIPSDMPAEGKPPVRDIGGVPFAINAPTPGTVVGTQPLVELEANLYELPTRRLLWTVVTETHEANAIEDIARSHARALIKAMREAGYVAPK